MRTFLHSAMLLVLAGWSTAHAADRLVLELDLDRDVLSLAHHIDGFPFAPTMNFSPDVAGNLSERVKVPALEHHLVASSLVRIDGEVAGFATEQESVRTDPATGKLYAESAWLITLHHPRASGFLAVTQRENAAPTFALVQKVVQDPDGDWSDEPQRFLSTDGETRVKLATGGLAAYEGGRFEEYNFVTTSDLRKYGRFRARIEFVVYPKE